MEFNKNKWYIYPLYSGFKVGKVTRINKKSVVFDRCYSVNESDYHLISEVDDKDIEKYNNLILFGKYTGDEIESACSLFAESYNKLREIDRVKDYPGVNIDWSEFQSEVDRLRNTLKALCDNCVEIAGKAYGIIDTNFKDGDYLMTDAHENRIYRKDLKVKETNKERVGVSYANNTGKFF